MIISLLVGSSLVFITMSIQVSFVVLMMRYIIKLMKGDDWDMGSYGFDISIMGIVLLGLFLGHLAQIAIWATLFVQLSEFTDFVTAFYHSTVNFTSLGYGDIVMTKRWRLLGALEAANGVLMFGLSTGTILSVMNRLFHHHVPHQTSGKGKAN